MPGDNYRTYLIRGLSAQLAEGPEPTWRNPAPGGASGSKMARASEKRTAADGGLEQGVPAPTPSGAPTLLGFSLIRVWDTPGRRRPWGGRRAKLGSVVSWHVHSSEGLHIVLLKCLFNICLEERLSSAWGAESEEGRLSKASVCP